jgi:hypothetical protein
MFAVRKNLLQLQLTNYNKDKITCSFVFNIQKKMERPQRKNVADSVLLILFCLCKITNKQG